MTKNSKQIKRVAVYVDGSNLYYKLKDCEIKNITYFGYAALSEWLSQERKIIAKRYYIGVVRSK